MARPMSDHKPILLSCNIEDWGPPPWRFEGMWLFENSLLDLMAEWWNSFVVSGPPGFQLAKKFQLLKAKIRVWNKEVFGNIDRKFELTLDQIKLLDQLADEGSISMDQLDTRNHLKLKFEDIADMQEMHYRAKSRIQWQMEGDRNTKYYHRIAKSRRRRNTFSKLRIEGSWVEDKKTIKDSIVSHFQERFKLKDDFQFSLSNLGLNSISEEESVILEKRIEEEEVLLALKRLGQDRAPGPDGFQVNVIVKCWSFMKNDIMEVVRKFESSGFIDWRLKSTFISLLPKKSVVEEIKDLRPISLSNTVFKAISKVLAERLKLLLSKLVSNSQTAFIKGLQILDNILIANECLDSRLKSKKSGLISKIDLEKAFDNVKWSLVDEVLQQMGFGQIWRMWIKGCIEKIPFSILVNGSSCGKFISEKGLRQGDPLSPFLFLLVSEVLNIMFSKASRAGKVGGFIVKNGGTTISHLQFADDTLVFLDVDLEQVRFLKYILLSFEFASGLSTNFSKCSLFAVGEVNNLNTSAAVFGCSCEAFPSIYLGLPLGEQSLSKSKWDRVIETCKDRLASSKRSSLTKEGIRKLNSMNKALLMKWWWCLGKERNSLWAKITFEKYGCSDLGWRTKKTTSSHGVSLWRNIYKVAEDFFKFTQFKIGRGHKILFGEDKWCAQGPFAETFPRLYEISNIKHCSLLQLYVLDESGCHWNFGISHRHLYDAEIAEFTVLTPILNSVVFSPDEDDELVWVGESSGAFSVNLLTIDNLQRRNCSLSVFGGSSTTNLCSLFNNMLESGTHLFWNCRFTHQVWAYFFAQANVQFPTFSSLLNLFKNWSSVATQNDGKEIWKRIPARVCWNVWNERNVRTFNGKKSTVEAIIADSKISAFHWAAKNLTCTNLLHHDVISNWRDEGILISLSFWLAVSRFGVRELMQRSRTCDPLCSVDDVSSQDFEASYQPKTDFLKAFAIVGAAAAGDVGCCQSGHSHGLVFGLGYAGIIFEESLAFNKSGLGLLMAVSLWVIRSIGDYLNRNRPDKFGTRTTDVAGKKFDSSKINNVAPPQKAFLGLNLNAGSTSNPSLGFSNEFDFNVQIPSDTANESGGYWSHGTSGPVWIPD
ncbi:uncharacterized protein LOC113316707 [Papaver somniferum]|uniref:uncharacterized protein LOC113316707 n=1 Tax=Papaver somniferum TaxID=3469 RepID=UPI000E7039C9|nr:uncharacterized protein LOC113316707 [Papaver somniferum]